MPRIRLSKARVAWVKPRLSRWGKEDYTNTGDIWWPDGSPVTMVQSPAFAALLLA
jgi:hypothetical protein